MWHIKDFSRLILSVLQKICDSYGIDPCVNTVNVATYLPMCIVKCKFINIIFLQERFMFVSTTEVKSVLSLTKVHQFPISKMDR